MEEFLTTFIHAHERQIHRVFPCRRNRRFFCRDRNAEGRERETNEARRCDSVSFLFFVCATRTKEKTNQQKRTREIHDTRGARKVVEDMTGRHFQLIESARRSKAKKGKRNDNKEKAKCRKTNTKTSQKKKNEGVWLVLQQAFGDSFFCSFQLSCCFFWFSFRRSRTRRQVELRESPKCSTHRVTCARVCV